MLTQPRHNRFHPDTAFPQIDERSDGFNELCTIIAKYNAHNYFRLRLLHRHMTIPEGKILLGTAVTESAGFWTRLIPISEIDLQKIHPHTISADADRYAIKDKERHDSLTPSEFREGSPIALGVCDEFFTEFSDCLWANGYENTLGLEAIRNQPGKMVEFTFDAGSLLLPESCVQGDFEYQVTSWSITVKKGVVLKDGETRCVILQGRHLRATKIQVKDFSDALRLLIDQGFVASKFET